MYYPTATIFSIWFNKSINIYYHEPENYVNLYTLLSSLSDHSSIWFRFMYLSYKLDYLGYHFVSPYVYPGLNYEDANMYPQGYNQDNNYALALAGYSFSTRNKIAFDIFITSKNISHYKVRIESQVEVVVITIRAFLLVTNPLSDWISI